MFVKVFKLLKQNNLYNMRIQCVIGLSVNNKMKCVIAQFILNRIDCRWVVYYS